MLGPQSLTSPDPYDAVTEELAAAMRWTTMAASRQVMFALGLARHSPTADALEQGRIDAPRARVIVDGLADVPREIAGPVEYLLLEVAADLTTAQLRTRLERALLEADPGSAEQRRRARRRHRSVVHRPGRDGLSTLTAELSSDAAAACSAALDEHARRIATRDDGRTHDARRADALVGLILGRPADPDGGIPGPDAPAAKPGTAVHVHVNVTVGLDVLAGLSDAPGELAGCGPIPAELARRLAAHPDATWRRLVVDPLSGTLLDVGHQTYRPPAGLDRFVRLRDSSCRFPGCRRTALKGDLDHGVPWPAGPTAASNLAALCRRHHRLKTRGRWRLLHRPDGVLLWCSPGGRRYLTFPAEYQPAPFVSGPGP
jgi:hypothetical protein